MQEVTDSSSVVPTIEPCISCRRFRPNAPICGVSVFLGVHTFLFKLMKRNVVILEKTQRSLRSAFGLSHAGRPRILRTSCSCAASSKPFRKRGFSLASGGHGFCPTDGKNLSSRVCRSHTVAVGRIYALTRRWDFATVIAPIGSFFRKSAGMRKYWALAEGNLPCASDFSLFAQIFLQRQKSLP